MKDKEHTLGSVLVPVAELKSSPKKLWLPLQPHKKASEAHGSLQLSCWVTHRESTLDSTPNRASEHSMLWSDNSKGAGVGSGDTVKKVDEVCGMHTCHGLCDFDS